MVLRTIKQAMKERRELKRKEREVFKEAYKKERMKVMEEKAVSGLKLAQKRGKMYARREPIKKVGSMIVKGLETSGKFIAKETLKTIKASKKKQQQYKQKLKIKPKKEIKEKEIKKADLLSTGKYF